jgi:glyoxylase-like metal-dependent hydrolase (beta-lactamase superfamily II)
VFLLHAAAESHGLGDVRLCGVLLTHLHMGHYLGLMQFGREAMDWKGLQVCSWQGVHLLTI